LSYLRTKEDVEIDLIIERPGSRKLLVEIKSTNQVREEDAKSLETLCRDLDPKADKWILFNDTQEQKFGSTVALCWQTGTSLLFGL
jgi:predicted AAA+ superfamily ATPase